MTKKVLYVDDDPGNLKLFEVLFGEKFDLLLTTSTIEAEQFLKADPSIRVVISDRDMPNRDGVDFVSEMSKQYPTKVYYMFSGLEQRSDVDKFIDSGVIRKYFNKPFNQYEMANEISKVLGSSN